jgi:hypothetical protein
VQLTTFANAACESFMKTLKYEEVYCNEYRDLSQARAFIREFLEKIYNQKRLHSALGYLPPAEPISAPGTSRMPLCGSFLYEFSEACAIYRSDVGLDFAQSSTGVPPPVGRHRESAQGRDRDRTPAHRPR